jgi:hypothetical protein
MEKVDGEEGGGGVNLFVGGDDRVDDDEVAEDDAAFADEAEEEVGYDTVVEILGGFTTLTGLRREDDVLLMSINTRRRVFIRAIIGRCSTVEV